MISEPINWYPSMFIGDGNDTIDATEENTFSCNVQCTGYIYAYDLMIMQNDTDSTLVYDSSPVRLSTPYVPRNNRGKLMPLEIIVPNNTSMTNGYENGYKWHLLLWEADAGESATSSAWLAEDHYTTHEYLFYAKTGTSVEVNTDGWDPQIVTSKSKVFTATYDSPDMIQWFRWNLAVVDPDTGDKSVIYTTDKIYSFDTTFEFDQFITGNTYAIQVEIYNQGGIYQQSDWVVFPVEYEVLKMSSITNCEVTGHGLTVTWSSALYIQGKVVDDLGRPVEPGTYGQPDYKYGLLYNWPIDDKYCLDMESGVQTVFQSNEDYDVLVDQDGAVVLSVMLRPYNGDRQHVLRIEMENGVVETLDHMGFSAGLAPSNSLTPSSSLVPQKGDDGMFVYSGSGHGASNFITNEDESFLTLQSEQLVVSDKTVYYVTKNPMMTIYTITFYDGEMSVIEHPAPPVLPSHHVVNEGD